jgi:hypothetical protein
VAAKDVMAFEIQKAIIRGVDAHVPFACCRLPCDRINGDGPQQKIRNQYGAGAKQTTSNRQHTLIALMQS